MQAKEFKKAFFSLKKACCDRAFEILGEINEKEDEKKALSLKEANFCHDLGAEIESFSNLLLQATSKKTIIEVCPLVSGLWFGDEYEDVKGLEAVQKITKEIQDGSISSRFDCKLVA